MAIFLVPQKKLINQNGRLSLTYMHLDKSATSLMWPWHDSKCEAGIKHMGKVMLQKLSATVSRVRKYTKCIIRYIIYSQCNRKMPTSGSLVGRDHTSHWRQDNLGRSSRFLVKCLDQPPLWLLARREQSHMRTRPISRRTTDPWGTLVTSNMGIPLWVACIHTYNIHQTLTVVHLGKIPHFLCSFSCLQKPARGSYPEPYESNQHPHTLRFSDNVKNKVTHPHKTTFKIRINLYILR